MYRRILLCFPGFASHCGPRRSNRTDAARLLSMRTAGVLSLCAVLDCLRLRRRCLLRTMFCKLRIRDILRICIVHNILRSILCSLRFAIGMRCLRCNRRPCCLRRNRRLGFREVMRQRLRARRNGRNTGRNRCNRTAPYEKYSRRR